MAEPTKLAPIPQQSTLVTDGKITGEWSRWLTALKQRVESAIESSGGGGGGVGTIDASQIVSGTIDLARISDLTDAQIADAAAIAWAKISKTGSSLADLGVRSAADLTSGLLALARGGTAADLSATGGTGHLLKQQSTGAAVTVGALAESELPSAINADKIADGSVDNTEFETLDGVTSAIQPQIDSKGWHHFYRRWAAVKAGTTAAEGTLARGMGWSDGVISVAVSFRSGVSHLPFIGIGFRTSAVLGNVAQISSGTDRIWIDQDPSIYILFRTGNAVDVTDVRFWIGLSDEDIALNIDSPLTSLVAFRFSTGVDSGFIGAAGNSSTLNLSSAIASVAENTVYLLKIRISDSGTEAHFSVDGGAETTVAIPTISEALVMVVNMSNKAAAIRQAWWGQFYIDYPLEANIVP